MRNAKNTLFLCCYAQLKQTFNEKNGNRNRLECPSLPMPLPRPPNYKEKAESKAFLLFELCTFGPFGYCFVVELQCTSVHATFCRSRRASVLRHREMIALYVLQFKWPRTLAFLVDLQRLQKDNVSEYVLHPFHTED